MPRLTIIYDLEDRTLAIDGTENIQLVTLDLPHGAPLLAIHAAAARLCQLIDEELGTKVVPKGSGTGLSRP